MSRRPVRSQRLLDLLQILRRHRYPVAGHVLAGELGISLRTLYRDIATLRQQGAHIEGGAGARRCCASGVNGKASPRSERLLPETDRRPPPAGLAPAL